MAAVLLLWLSAPALKALSLFLSVVLSMSQRGEATCQIVVFLFWIACGAFWRHGRHFSTVSRAAYFSFIHLRRALPTEIAPFFRSIRDGRGS